ncbi:non-classical arabinogalactan protein 30 [Magnolia sinica]|uniref:non-classical arabinogalactan protein 30 n=1 Tax=Magnolia sinica TaxID=86752 RepID=UPI00265ADCC8|nr:non-classical arabinogalactan protein 30 [Magnolia sinica]
MIPLSIGPHVHPNTIVLTKHPQKKFKIHYISSLKDSLHFIHLFYSIKSQFKSLLHQNMTTQNLFFLSTFLLLVLAIIPFETTQATHEVGKVVEPVVEGMVYCQSCNHIGSWSLTDAQPIPSAKVSVVCKDYKGRVSFYKVFTADQNGYFYGQLQGYKVQNYYLDHPLQSCTVHLVSSPNPKCNLVSNINYGLDGAPLRYDHKTLSGENYEAVIYGAGPLAFRPSYCVPVSH